MAKRKAKYELRKSSDRQYYAVLVGKNGEDLSVTEMITSTQNVRKNIKAQKTAIAEAEIVDMTGE